MPIENDKRARENADRIRTIQLYQEQQRLAEEAARREQLETDDVAKAAQSEPDIDQNPDAQGAAQAQDAAQAAAQNQAQNQTVAAVGEATEMSGADKHDEAVNAASAQQDRGESWQEFAHDAEQTEIPMSVEEQARAEREQEDKERKEQQQINMRDLQNLIKIKGGKIDA